MACRKSQVQLSDEALRRVITDYTREAGVRSLERQIGALLRNAAVTIASGDAASVSIDAAAVQRILGAARFENDVALRTSVPGVATGLAWTPAGGDILFIESSRVRGSGKLILTGQLGEVMKESAQAAVTLVKSQADRLGIDPAVLDNSDLHIHVPAGAIPKDGPSAGVAIATSLASLLTQRTVRADVAMTGEISLRGVVMPVGGIKEKCVAAARAGIRTVILPARNRRDLEDIPDSVRTGLEFVWAEKDRGRARPGARGRERPAGRRLSQNRDHRPRLQTGLRCRGGFAPQGKHAGSGLRERGVHRVAAEMRHEAPSPAVRKRPFHA